MKKLRASLTLVALLVGGISQSAFAQQSGESRPSSRADGDASRHSVREVYGKILTVDASKLTIETRTRQIVTVDATDAVRNHMSVPFVVGHAVVAKGQSDAKNVLHAQIILRAKGSPDMWPADQ